MKPTTLTLNLTFRDRVRLLLVVIRLLPGYLLGVAVAKVRPHLLTIGRFAAAVVVAALVLVHGGGHSWPVASAHAVGLTAVWWALSAAICKAIGGEDGW